MKKAPPSKVALSHDWLNGMRGGEKCLEVFCELYPDSPIYTLLYEPEKVSETIKSHPVRASSLQRLPGFKKNYRNYLPLFPKAIQKMNTKGHELIISTSHCVAKGIRRDKKALHISYCFTPMRYAWGFFDDYFGGKNLLARWAIKAWMKRLRKWDLESNAGVDYFIAISEHIRKRIQNCYKRDSAVIYPPVDTHFYTPDYRVPREDFYLVVSALVPYKKVDHAVKAAKKAGKKLIVIGEGPDRKRLEKMAAADTVFMGWQADAVLRDHYRRAKALLFPGEEDFGIVPVEAQACGLPVIAYGVGGATETVLSNETGVLYNEQKESALVGAIFAFEKLALDAEFIRKNAMRFSRDRFAMEIKAFIQTKTASFGRRA